MRFVFLGAANPETARMIRAVERVDPDFKPYGFLDNDAAKKGSPRNRGAHASMCDLRWRDRDSPGVGVANLSDRSVRFPSAA